MPPAEGLGHEAGVGRGGFAPEAVVEVGAVEIEGGLVLEAVQGVEEGEGVGAAGDGYDEARAGCQVATTKGVADERVDTVQHADLLTHGAIRLPSWGSLRPSTS